MSLPSLDSIFAPVLLVCVVWIAYQVYDRRRRSIADIPGPPSSSFLFGHMRELLTKEVGEADFPWHDEYGPVLRYKGCFGRDVLMIADPLVLQHIYRGNDAFRRPGLVKAPAKLGFGNGLVTAEGAVHKRQRKVMQPAFSVPHIAGFVPLFFRNGERLVQYWKRSIGSDGSGIVDVTRALSKTTLDALGDAGFDYQFGALDDKSNELTDSYRKLVSSIIANPTDATILVQNGIMAALPEGVLDILLKLPVERFQAAKDNNKLTTEVAKGLVHLKNEARKSGLDSKDVMSLLLDANASTDAAEKMTDKELLAQMTTLMFAGHETTANSLDWTLFELASRPQLQDKLRAEIRSARAAAQTRGDPDLTAHDLERLPILNSICKEVLRFHPVVYVAHRVAIRDEVLPLSKPLKLSSGRHIKEIPIRKGQVVTSNIAAYQRSKEVWGEDANVFRPERWLGDQPKRDVTLGLIGNLMVFGTGYRPCIGWRFSVVEMQCLIIEMISAFEFSLPRDGKRVVRETGGVMAPTLEGERHKGAQLPLLIKLVD